MAEINNYYYYYYLRLGDSAKQWYERSKKAHAHETWMQSNKRTLWLTTSS